MLTETDLLIRLDDYLPFLVNRVGPRIEQGFAEPLRRAGVTLPMWRVMAVLRVEGAQRLGSLGRATSMPLSSLSRLISDMVDDGLLSRDRNRSDGRAVHVDLTERGRALAAEISNDATAYETAMTRNMAAREVAELKRLLTRLHDDLSDLAVPATGKE